MELEQTAWAVQISYLAGEAADRVETLRDQLFAEGGAMEPKRGDVAAWPSAYWLFAELERIVAELEDCADDLIYDTDFGEEG